MVALLRYQPTAGRRPGPPPARLRLLPGGGAAAGPVARSAPVGGAPSVAESGLGPGVERPRLHLVSGEARSGAPSLRVVVAVALVVFGLLGSVRVVQGPARPDPDPGGIAAGVIAEGDRVVVARPGDSLWTIASRLAPDRDPRPIVAALIDANGGASVQIGQEIVIPGHLLD